MVVSREGAHGREFCGTRSEPTKAQLEAVGRSVGTGLEIKGDDRNSAVMFPREDPFIHSPGPTVHQAYCVPLFFFVHDCMS